MFPILMFLLSEDMTLTYILQMGMKYMFIILQRHGMWTTLNSKKKQCCK